MNYVLFDKSILLKGSNEITLFHGKKIRTRRLEDISNIKN